MLPISIANEPWQDVVSLELKSFELAHARPRAIDPILACGVSRLNTFSGFFITQLLMARIAATLNMLTFCGGLILTWGAW